MERGDIKDKEGNIKQEKGKQKGTMGLDSESPVFFKCFQKEAHQKSTLSERKIKYNWGRLQPDFINFKY